MSRAACFFCMLPLLAQVPEARTPEEFDDYLSVEAAPADTERVGRAVAFARRWPDSRLMARVHEIRFFALQKLGRAAEARAAAAESLRLSPGNATTAAALALQLAGEDPAEARRLAEAALAWIDRNPLPRSVPIEQARRIAGRDRSRAHTALGIVMFRAGDTAGALRELETAEKAASEPDPALALRLGRLYAALGRITEAKARFEIAVRSNEPDIVTLAKSGLAGLAKR